MRQQSIDPLIPHRPVRVASPVLVLVLVVLFLAPATAAQAWVSLDGSPAGTPAEIVFDAQASNEVDTFLDVIVHGFWTEDVAPGDGNVYQHIQVPGLARLGITGAPDLPVARVRLAVSTFAPVVSLVSVVDLDPHVFAGQLPYPTVIEEQDEAFDPGADPGPGDPDGTPAQFTINPVIYAGPIFPSTPGTAFSTVRDLLGPIPGAIPEIYPARFDPVIGELHISGHLRVHLAATGVSSTRPPMTKDRAVLAAATFVNWPDQLTAFPTNTQSFAGRYLIVASQLHEVPLQVFVDFKRARGFEVDVIRTESLPAVTCAQIRTAIRNWYQAGDPWADHYALLVGDRAQLPWCSSPTFPSVPTDDLFGSPLDGDLDEELYVGRLSVDGPADLSAQLVKLMGYVTDDVGTHYDEVVLVAHEEGSPGKYQGAQDAVMAASYAVPPHFQRIYGSSAFADNSDVVDAAQGGFGVMAYRGHGSQTSWWNWNTLGEDFHKNELLGIGNATALGVVWAFDCWNNDISHTGGTIDSLGEAWMEVPGSGAVAHYGSSAVSGTQQNHELDRRMFEAVFDRGLLRHGQAIAWAEARAVDTAPGLNPWMYLLLGDPSMTLRREDAAPLVLSFPSEVPVCPSGGPCQPIVVRVTDAAGTPIEGALVALHQGGPPGEPPTLLVNAYTDGSGSASFPQGPTGLAGHIDVTGSDPCGNESQGSLGVVDGVWSNFGAALPGVQGVPLLQAEGPLVPASLVELDLENAAQNAVTGLFVALSSVPVPLKGGELLAHPWLFILDLVTDGQGDIALAAPLPLGIPADTELWFQYAIADPAATQGVALSNAMRGIVP